MNKFHGPIKMILLTSAFLLLVQNAMSAEPEAATTSVVEPVRLPDLLSELYEKNPDILAAKADWDAARKGIIQAWALPDPKVGMEVMGEMVETRVGPQENRLMISQMIPFPWKLWKQRSAASAQSESIKQEYFAVRREMEKQLRQTYYKLYWVDATIQVIEEVQSILKKFEGAAQARYSNRGGEQRDVSKAQAEVSITLEELFRMRSQRHILVARLNAILNRSPFSEFGRAQKPDLEKTGKTLYEFINLAAENREEIKKMEALLDESKQERTLARLQNIPDIEVGFSYTWVGNGMTMDEEDGKDSWMFPLQVNVPLWQNRIIPAMQAANAKVKAAEARLDQTSNQTFYEVSDAYHRFDTASKIVVLYETAVIPQAKLALNSDQAGYESGKIDFLNLLDSERMYLNAQLSYIRVYTEALESYADLSRATGLDLTGGAS